MKKAAEGARGYFLTTIGSTVVGCAQEVFAVFASSAKRRELFLEDKRYFHEDSILVNLAGLVDGHFLVLNPGGLHVFERLTRSFDSILNGILEALLRRGFDLGDSCNGHWTLFLPVGMAKLKRNGDCMKEHAWEVYQATCAGVTEYPLSRRGGAERGFM